MPRIKVEKGRELKLRFAPGEPWTEMGEGEHELTDEQLAHWYVQGAIDDGRAHEVPDRKDGKAEESAAKIAEDDTIPVALVEVSELKEMEAKLAAEAAAHTDTQAKLADAQAEIESLKGQLAGAQAAPEIEPVTVETPAEPADLEGRMLAAFPRLEEGDYKTDGTPKVKAVETLLDEDVTADQVAAAWAKYEEGK